MKTIDKNNLKISVLLYDFINDEVIPGTNIESSKFWEGFSNAVHELAPICLLYTSPSPRDKCRSRMPSSA